MKDGAFIGSGTKITGSLIVTSPVEIYGEVEGEIHSKSAVVIGQGANVKAKIVADSVEVSGVVQGDIIANKSLVLRKPAKVIGNISSKTLKIEEGVTFEGRSTMIKAEQKPVESKKDETKRKESFGEPQVVN